MSPGTLATVMWSVAALHHYDADLCEAAATAATRQLPEAKGMHVAMVCWSFAHLRHASPSFFTAAAEEVRWGLGLLGVFWGVAHCSCCCQTMGGDLSSSCRIQKAPPSYHIHPPPHPQPPHAIHRQMSFRAGELEPQHVAQLAWAFVTRKVYHRELYDALAQRAIQLGGRLQPQHISNLAHAFAKQAHRCGARLWTQPAHPLAYRTHLASASGSSRERNAQRPPPSPPTPTPTPQIRQHGLGLQPAGAAAPAAVRRGRDRGEAAAPGGVQRAERLRHGVGDERGAAQGGLGMGWAGVGGAGVEGAGEPGFGWGSEISLCSVI